MRKLDLLVNHIWAGPVLDAFAEPAHLPGKFRGRNDYLWRKVFWCCVDAPLKVSDLSVKKVRADIHPSVLIEEEFVAAREVAISMQES